MAGVASFCDTDGGCCGAERGGVGSTGGPKAAGAKDGAVGDGQGKAVEDASAAEAASGTDPGGVMTCANVTAALGSVDAGGGEKKPVWWGPYCAWYSTKSCMYSPHSCSSSLIEAARPRGGRASGLEDSESGSAVADGRGRPALLLAGATK